MPSEARSDSERYHIARLLVDQTVLAQLRPELQLCILNMTTLRLDREVTTAIDHQGLAMPNFMWWEKEYVENPYMRALPMKDLNQRFHDLIPNALSIQQGGKVGMEVTPNGVEWVRYMQHLFKEAQMREAPHPLFLDRRYEPDWSRDGFVRSVKDRHSSKAFDAVKTWAEAGSDRKFSVAKYGEKYFMEKFLREGEMLVSSSPSFDDEMLTRAQRDDENSFSVFGARGADGSFIPASDLPASSGDRRSLIEYRKSMDRDYMLYCMSRTLSPTLFSHFGTAYDACVLVHNMDEFVRRVDEGTRKHFPPEEFTYAHSWITYIDPLGAIQPTPEPAGDQVKIPIPFLKHFRHTYQSEYRFVWLPKQVRRGLGTQCVSIGSIDDIAEIILV